MSYTVQTTVRGLKVGDTLSNGSVIEAVSQPFKDRHINRYLCRVQFVGQNYCRQWSASTTLKVQREVLP